MVFQSDESIIIGTRAISGSAPTRFKNFAMHFGESNIPSSKFTSIMFAPFSTWLRATDSASENLPSFIILRNAGDPITFVLSPTKINGAFSSGDSKASSPDKTKAERGGRGLRGGKCAHFSTIAAMCLGVVPQHPPMTFSNPSFAYSKRWPAVS